MYRKKIGAAQYLVTRSVARMFELADQYRCPTGHKGKLVAALMNQEHEPLTSWGLTKVTIGSDYVVLDVGCGGGRTVNRLAHLAPDGKVFGIDYSVDMVKFSKKINKTLIAQNRVEIIDESVEKMSFTSDLFDLVTAFETYYFWTNLHNALEEIQRVLKPSGKLLLVNELACEGTKTEMAEKFHLSLFPFEEICSVMMSVGFRSVQVFTEAESSWNAILAQKIVRYSSLKS